MLLRNLNISTGALQAGCELCLLGKKMTLFITGLCPNRCYYCPVSAEKMWKDKIYANERPVSTIADVYREIRESGATGTAITGGEPLMVVDRVAQYVKGIKGVFGSNHHIHLYSGFPYLKRENAHKLFQAGLDEVRFHIIATKGVEDSIRVASEFSWRVGVEIPALPDLDYLEIAKTARESGAKFMILDEYEVNEENYFATTMRQKGHRELLSVSQNHIQDIVKKISLVIPVHYCTVRSKYLIQYRNRLVNSFRAKKITNAVLLDDGSTLKKVGRSSVRFLPVFGTPVYEDL
jgi:pyruvate formate-lyase activating enzyme-like uncharacterized protein